MDHELYRRCVNTLRGLAMDAVQAANSGHPGMPMGAADMATVLFTEHLKFDPKDPQWPDRDRFILSAGHGSMLLYGALHLAGYDLSLDDIKQFRQLGSRTPGHPEYGHTAGVETTTGPLGQGFATGVGMAIAERVQRETFGEALCDHFIYAIVSDGDLMEGVAQEAASLAGHLKLGRLIYLYDDNEITIDGGTELSFTEDRLGRLAAAGWHVQQVDGHDPKAISAAIHAAREVSDRPSLIACRTVIGKGSPNLEGTSKSHGAPLGEEEIRRTKERLGLDPDLSFDVPSEVVQAFRQHDGPAQRLAWEGRLQAHPQADTFRRWLRHDPSVADGVTWPTFEIGAQIATRKASASVLKAIYAATPWVIGGSADLAGSNGTGIGAKALLPDDFAHGGTVNFGVREHAMGAACNGMALHGLRPYSATFLVFHDYQRPSVRLSALMGLPVTWIYTHDSVFLGEDGPTHQPIATLLTLRATPGLRVWRPADAHETAIAWEAALRRTDGPTSLILTRQGLPVLDPASTQQARRGGYILRDTPGEPDLCLLATGSEVSLCLDAAEVLAGRGIEARVVSLPCRELFSEQDPAYQRAVLPAGTPRISVEAGLTLGWERWLGADGLAIGIDTFGWSAPAEAIAEHIGFTPQAIAERAATWLARRATEPR